MTGFNRRQFLVYGSAALGSSFLFNACANSPTTSSSPTSSAASPSAASSAAGFKAAMVLPGIITDKAWNQAGYTGLEEIKSKLGAETAYVEKVGQADQAEALSDFARRGFNLVYAHGGQFDAAAKQVAAQFPKTFFVVVNGSATAPNVASLWLDNLQVSYLCGILAASVSKTGKLAYIAGQEFLATQEELFDVTDIAFPASVRHNLEAQTLALYSSTCTSSVREPLQYLKPSNLTYQGSILFFSKESTIPKTWQVISKAANSYTCSNTSQHTE